MGLVWMGSEGFSLFFVFAFLFFAFLKFVFLRFSSFLLGQEPTTAIY